MEDFRLEGPACAAVKAGLLAPRGQNSHARMRQHGRRPCRHSLGAGTERRDCICDAVKPGLRFRAFPLLRSSARLSPTSSLAISKGAQRSSTFLRPFPVLGCPHMRKGASGYSGRSCSTPRKKKEFVAGRPQGCGPEQAALHRPSAIRGLRGAPDCVSGRGCGRLAHVDRCCPSTRPQRQTAERERVKE